MICQFRNTSFIYKQATVLVNLWISNTCSTRINLIVCMLNHYAKCPTHWALYTSPANLAVWLCMLQWHNINLEISMFQHWLIYFNELSNSVLRIYSHSIPWWRSGEWLVFALWTGFELCWVEMNGTNCCQNSRTSYFCLISYIGKFSYPHNFF